NSLAFDESELKPCTQRHFDSGPSNFSISLGGVAVTHIEQRSWNIDREIQRVAYTCFRRVHIAAVLGGNNLAARLAASGSNPYAAEERMQRNFHRKVGIERPKGSGIAGAVDRVIPDFFWEGRVEHRGVISRIERAEARSRRAHTLITINLNLQKFNHQRIARFGTLQGKPAGKRIIAFHHAYGVAGFS